MQNVTKRRSALVSGRDAITSTSEDGGAGSMDGELEPHQFSFLVVTYIHTGDGVMPELSLRRRCCAPR